MNENVNSFIREKRGKISDVENKIVDLSFFENENSAVTLNSPDGVIMLAVNDSNSC